MPSNERNDIVNQMNEKFKEQIASGESIPNAYTYLVVNNPPKALQGCAFDFEFTPVRSARLKNLPSETEVKIRP